MSWWGSLLIVFFTLGVGGIVATIAASRLRKALEEEIESNKETKDQWNSK